MEEKKKLPMQGLLTVFGLGAFLVCLFIRISEESSILILWPFFLLVPAYFLDYMQDKSVSFSERVFYSFLLFFFIGAFLIVSIIHIGCGLSLKGRWLLIYILSLVTGIAGGLFYSYKLESNPKEIRARKIKRIAEKGDPLGALKLAIGYNPLPLDCDLLMETIADISFSDAPDGNGKWYEQDNYPFSERILYNLYSEHEDCKNAGRIKTLTELLLDHYIKNATTEAEFNRYIGRVHPQYKDILKEKLQKTIDSTWASEDSAYESMSALFLKDGNLLSSEERTLLSQYDRFIDSFPESNRIVDVCKGVAPFLEDHFVSHIQFDFDNGVYDEEEEKYYDFEVDTIVSDSKWEDEAQARKELSFYTDKKLRKLNREGQVEAVGEFRKFIREYPSSPSLAEVYKRYIEVLRILGER